jgi:hypothetical protein
MDELEKKEINLEKKKEVKKQDRRGFFSGILSVLAIGILVAPRKSYGDAVGGDTTILGKISASIEAKYAIIAPYIKMLQEQLETAKNMFNLYNEFVRKFNTVMQWFDDLRKFMTQPQENIFYLQYLQIVNYFNNIMKQKNNDLLSFRLQTFNPVLISKIDSLGWQIENLGNRAKNIAKTYIKNGENSNSNSGNTGNSATDNSTINNEIDSILNKFTNKEQEDKITRSTKTGKAAIRASNDNAKYIEAIAKINAIKDSVGVIKEKHLPEYMRINKTEKNPMEIYNEMIFPKMFEAMVLQCSIQAEMYQKMNDLFLILTKEEPLVSSSEKLVSRNDIKNLVMDISKNASEVKNKYLA